MIDFDFERELERIKREEPEAVISKQELIIRLQDLYNLLKSEQKAELKKLKKPNIMFENWHDHGPPFTDFTEELTEQWKKAGGLGFSLNVARDWLNIGLKKDDYDFAYWLELNGYSPEWVLNHGDEKDLRKKHKKFVKKQPKTKKPKVVHAEPKDPTKCDNCAKNTFYSFKSWQQHHGERKRDLREPWITVIRRPFLNTSMSGYMEYIEMCGECKVKQVPHLNTCSYSKN